MRYIAYTRQSVSKKVRSSDGKMVLEEDPLSHRMQIDEIRKSIGCEPIIFSESDVSRDSTIDDRPVLFQALNSLKKDDVFVVWKSNRLVADHAVLQIIINMIEKKKAKLMSVTEPTIFEDNPVSEMIRHMIIAIGRYEVQNIRNNVKKAMQSKKARGERVGRIPYGYSLSEKNMIIPNEEEQKIVEYIHKMKSEEGLTFIEISQRLNSEGLLNRDECLWSKSAVHRILQNRIRHRECYFPI